MLRREPEQPRRRSPGRRSAAAATAGADRPAARAPAVFERLRAWRAAAAKEQGVPAYVIFHDATLRQIAARRPSTLAELARSAASAKPSWPSTASRSSSLLAASE